MLARNAGCNGYPLERAVPCGDCRDNCILQRGLRGSSNWSFLKGSRIHWTVFAAQKAVADRQLLVACFLFEKQAAGRSF